MYHCTIRSCLRRHRLLPSTLCVCAAPCSAECLVISSIHPLHCDRIDICSVCGKGLQQYDSIDYLTACTCTSSALTYLFNIIPPADEGAIRHDPIATAERQQRRRRLGTDSDSQQSRSSTAVVRRHHSLTLTYCVYAPRDGCHALSGRS